MSDMKICFVLPQILRKPNGGYKMVYEYAKRLSLYGYDISIVYLNDNALRNRKVPEWLKIYIVKLMTAIFPTWIELPKTIKKISSNEKNWFKYLSDSDICVATAISTVETVARYCDNKKVIYFIQGYETWAASEEYLSYSYNIGFHNVVVAKWLKELVESKSGKNAILIKNAIDTNCYKLINKKRNEHSIALLYHNSPKKGFKIALKCVEMLRMEYKDLSVTAFGASKKPKNLPSWIKYIYNASQSKTIEIYNSAEVFLCAAIEDGFGLTGLEAMACGAVLVSTGYKGVYEYAINEFNSLISPVENVECLTANVKRIFEDDELKGRLINNAISTVQDFTWEKSIKKFENVINTISE